MDHELRTCKRCGVTKPLSAYYKDYTRTRRAYRIQKQCRLCTMDVQRRRRYGLAEGQYAEMLDTQGGACAICRKTCSSGRDLAIDHDHATGAVRGLLCGGCNRMLGQANDNVDVLRAGADYLERMAS